MSATVTASGYYRPTFLDVDALVDAHGGNYELEDAIAIARALGAMASGHQWWIGDLLEDAEERFGEEWSQLEDELGLPVSTAMNYRYVASRIDRSRRREPLTFSHYAELARLEPEQIDAMTERAIAESWTVRQLRDAVAIEYPSTRAGETVRGPELSEHEQRTIAKRLEMIDAALGEWRDAGERPTKLSQYVSGDDVSWLLRELRRLSRSG